MLALGGRSAAACLNFADSAWLLAVPSAFSDLADVRRAAIEAVTDFQRRQAASSLLSPDAEEPTCSDSSSPSSSDNTGSSDAEFEVPVTMDSDIFRLDILPEMDLGTYYTSLAEALLMDPPSAATGAYWDNVECFDGEADVALWSY